MSAVESAKSAMSVSPQVVELSAGALRLALRPDLGGVIAGLWHGGLPVLRSTEPLELQTSHLSACYPLVPYSNRIGWRRFSWLGKEYTTQPNYKDNPHSLHGVGWLRPWTVQSQRDDDAVLHLAHPGDGDWPFPFEAQQAFALTSTGLNVGLSIVNKAAFAAPVGLGWHPYFPKRQQSHLHAELSERWESDAATQLPTGRVPQAGIEGDVVQLDFDHCFDGWSGAAILRDERLQVRLSSSLDHLVVYTPRTRDYYCVEPVSHVSNAIQMADPAAHGLRSLQPGERFEAWMKFDISTL
jgi:aldose 1-epimerase